jgi:hypothetical protein
MINDIICKIFDNIFENNINKHNYLHNYKLIYDLTSTCNECEVDLIKNSIIFNYQKLCIKYCEVLNTYDESNFLNKYYNLYNKTQKENDTFKKIFSYFLKNLRNFNTDDIFKQYWSDYVVKYNLEKINNNYLKILEHNNIDEVKKLIYNFKDNLESCYYEIINEIYYKFVKSEISKLRDNKNVKNIILFFSKISTLNKLYSPETICKIDNILFNTLINTNITLIIDSLKEHHNLLLKYTEEIATNNFSNVFPKFDAEIDIINKYHTIICKYSNKNFIELIEKLFISFYNPNFIKKIDTKNVKLIITYIQFINVIYDNLKFNINDSFMKDFSKEKLNNLHAENIKKFNLNKDFIRLFLKFIYQNVYDNDEDIEEMGIILNAIDEKELFGEMYKKLVIKRIFGSRKINIKNENLYLNKLIRKYQIDSALRVVRILNDYEKSLPSSQEFNYINNINSKIINTTYDIWDLKENTCKNFVNKSFENEYNEFKSRYQEYFSCKYENKTLSWCDNLTNCNIIFHGNELLCSLKQVDILSLFKENDFIDLNNKKLDKTILDSLVSSKILNLEDNKLTINTKVTTKKCLNIMKFLKHNSKNNSNSTENIKNKLLWEKETYIEAFIVKKLKKEGKIPKQSMFDISFKKYDNYQITNDFFDKILKKLEEQEYIEIKNNTLIYIP